MLDVDGPEYEGFRWRASPSSGTRFADRLSAHFIVSLQSGTRLGPYEVVSPLGAGGMGEVYRARDTRLGRTVALKVLPTDFSADSRSRRRLEQEAHAVSALNHPHICALYDVGSDGGVDYLVMEFLDGQTLSDRLAKGPLPIAEALTHAVHIADALGRAHRSGIVHRDVKPGNVMLTKDGAKLLDFGLARARGVPAAIGASVTRALSDAPLTQEGFVVGTIPYMAPEQLEGRETDARTDIFSLGAILYEMVSGQRPFQGGSQASVIAQIMTADPRPLTDVQPITPASLDRLVRQCLVKDPDARWQSASDIARQLEAILEEVRGPKSGGTSAATLAAPWWRRRAARRAFTVMLLLAIAGAVAGAFAVGRRTGTKAEPIFHRLTFRRGWIEGARFTKDGANVMYTARWDGNPRQVFTVSTDGVDSEERPQLKGLNVASLSSRNEVAALRGMTLTIAPVTGGTPRDLTRAVTSADWGPDGRLAATRADAVEYPIGTVIYRATNPFTVTDVRVSAGGDLLAFREHSLNHGRIVIVDASGRKKAQSIFLDAITPPVWHPSGKEVWFSAEHPTREAVRAMDLQGHERTLLRIPAMSLKDISRDGRVLLSNDNILYAIYGRGPGDPAERDLTYYGWSLLDDLSRDGQTIMFTEGGESSADNGWSVFIRGIDGSPPQRIGNGAAGKLSPDKKWIATVRGDANGMRLMLLPTGPGEERQIGQQEQGVWMVVGWLPDSSGFIYDHAEQIWLAPINGTPRAVSPKGWMAQQGQVATDGHLLCATTVPGEPDMYLCSIEGPISKSLPLFFDSSKFVPLGFTSESHKLWVATSASSTTGEIFTLDLKSGGVTPWKQLGVQVDRAGLSFSRRIAISADGNSYAYNFMRSLSTLYVVDGLR